MQLVLVSDVIVLMTCFSSLSCSSVNVNGISVSQVKRLLLQIQRLKPCEEVRVFSGITELDMSSAVESYIPIHPAVTPDHLLTKGQAASLLLLVKHLTKLVTNRYDVMRGIQFPSLNVFECSGSSDEDELLPLVMNQCPALVDITFGSVRGSESDWKKWDKLMAYKPQRIKQIKKLVISDYVVTDNMFQTNKFIRMMASLEHLSITSPDLFVDDQFFQNMHHLVLVNLTIYEKNRDIHLHGDHQPLTDSGVKVLLKNNPRLRIVALCGFPLTDKSLEYITDFVVSRGLDGLVLQSSLVTGFSESAVNKLKAAGGNNGMQSDRICVLM
jgi:hypothetical protein